MRKRLFTAEEFEALRPLLGRVTLDAAEIARALLVEGLNQTKAAVRFGLSRQRVHGIKQRFEAAARAVPTGWRRVEIWLPPKLADRVEAMAKKARADHAATRDIDT